MFFLFCNILNVYTGNYFLVSLCFFCFFVLVIYGMGIFICCLLIMFFGFVLGFDLFFVDELFGGIFRVLGYVIFIYIFVI